ncbi:MAG: choice-of-anchor Q domain-containing protein, partial [Planctomycetota bacterium]
MLEVDSTTDSVDGDYTAGNLSLREAILLANLAPDANTINFASPLFDSPQTIGVASQLPTITEPVSIVGPGADLLTLEAVGTGFRFFEVNDGDGSALIDVSLSGMKASGADVASIAVGEGRTGGAINNRENLTVANSVLVSNSAFAGGAIANRPGGSLTVSGSTLSGNSAVFSGGAVHLSSSLTNIINSTISGNSADNLGGAIYQYGSSGLVDDLTIEHSTFQNNDSAINTAIHATGVGTKDITLTHSIVEGVINNENVVGDFNILGSNNPGITGSNNLFNTDAMLGPLADNGGPTATHAPLLGSPAINAGDPVATLGDGTTPDFDQRGLGFRRIRQGRLDIGAIEYSPPLPPQGLIVSTNTDVEDGDYAPGQLSLREAITLANEAAGQDTITFDMIVSNISLGSQLPTIVEGVSIVGPGAGLLTIDAGLGGDGVRNGNGFRILDIDDGVAASLIPVEISGLTLTGGDVTGSGGAIATSEDLTIRDAVVESNHASSRGGGVMSIDPGGQARLSILNSTIHDNSSGGDGGGVANFGNMTITASTLSGNVSGDDGAAVFTYFYDSATIVDTLFADNTAYGFGGGIYNIQSNVTVSNSTLSGNEAVRGGAIFQRGNLDLNNSTLTGNSAINGGGIYGYRFKSATINNSIIANSTGTDIFHGVGFTKSGSHNLIEASSTIGLTNSLNGDPQLGPLADNDGPTLTHALLPGSPAINAANPIISGGLDQNGNPRVVGGVADIGAVEANPAAVRAMGTLSHGVNLEPPHNLRPSEVIFYKFDLDTSIAGVANSSLIIDTQGSSLQVSNNTELGLFNSAGSLIAFNDDIDAANGNFLSQLSFGQGGADGNLNAGTYYLAISGFNTTFGNSPFDAISSSNLAGDVVVSFDLDRGNAMNEIAFAGSRSDDQVELFRSNGLATGTNLLKNIGGRQSSSPRELTVVGDNLFFAATGADGEVELFKTQPNGTTSRVKDLAGPISSNPHELIDYNGTLHFVATGPDGETELYRSNGINTGTVRVKNLSGSASADPQELTIFDNRIFFTALSDTGERELYFSDSTGPGTTRLVNLYGQSTSSNPSDLTVIGDTLYFVATTPGGDRELHKTDGTAAGTGIVADLVGDSQPHELTEFAGTLYFVATENGQTELYSSDGTSGGTVQVADLSGSVSAVPRELTVAGGQLFFTANTSDMQQELHATDGTTTSLVTDLHGATNAFPQGLTAFESTLYFSAVGNDLERELYTSDGTAAGTVRIKDIAGTTSSSPHNMTAVGDLLYFAATLA